jgi:hypothetical protein
MGQRKQKEAVFSIPFVFCQQGKIQQDKAYPDNPDSSQ